jgi:hypothetical protein
MFAARGSSSPQDGKMNRVIKNAKNAAARGTGLNVNCVCEEIFTGGEEALNQKKQRTRGPLLFFMI